MRREGTNTQTVRNLLPADGNNASCVTVDLPNGTAVFSTFVILTFAPDSSFSPHKNGKFQSCIFPNKNCTDVALIESSDSYIVGWEH